MKKTEKLYKKVVVSFTFLMMPCGIMASDFNNTDVKIDNNEINISVNEKGNSLFKEDYAKNDSDLILPNIDSNLSTINEIDFENCKTKIFASDRLEDRGKFIKKRIPFSKSDHAKFAFAKNLRLKLTDEAKAVEGFQKILEEFPEFLAARLELINLYKKAQWNSEIKELIEDGIKLDNKSVPLLIEKARILIKENNLDEALTVLLKIRNNKMENETSVALLAYVYLQKGQIDLAGRTYSHLVRKDNSNSQYWLGLALSFELMGNNKQAISSFTKVKRLGGVNSDVLTFVNSKLDELQQLKQNISKK